MKIIPNIKLEIDVKNINDLTFTPSWGQFIQEMIGRNQTNALIQRKQIYSNELFHTKTRISMESFYSSGKQIRGKITESIHDWKNEGF